MNTNTIIYILVAIAVLAGGYLILTGSPEEANAPSEDVSETDGTGTDAADDSASADDGSAPMNDPEEADPEENDTPTGNDVGMEFPEPDAELDAEADAETETGGEPHVFTLDAFSYGYSQDELRVSEGDTVTIVLTNSDGFHDWVIDEFDAATDRIQEGDTATVTFVADEAGTYEFYCSVGNHRQQGMVGTLVVE